MQNNVAMYKIQDCWTWYFCSNLICELVERDKLWGLIHHHHNREYLIECCLIRFGEGGGLRTRREPATPVVLLAPYANLEIEQVTANPPASHFTRYLLFYFLWMPFNRVDHERFLKLWTQNIYLQRLVSLLTFGFNVPAIKWIHGKK